MIRKEDVKCLSQMSVGELEDVQVAMLYEWERAAWEKGQLQMSDTSFRGKMMDVIDVYITDLQRPDFFNV